MRGSFLDIRLDAYCFRVLLDDLEQFFTVYIVTDSRFPESEELGSSGIFRERARELMLTSSL